MLDSFSWQFYVASQSSNTDTNNTNTYNASSNEYYRIRSFINNIIFMNTHRINNKYDNKVDKLSQYLVEHFNYFSSLSYSDIEQNKLNFSIHRIKINYKDFVRNDLYNKSEYENYESVNKEALLKLYNNYKFMFINKPNNPNSIEEIITQYGTIPYNDPNNFKNIQYNKSYLNRISMFLRKEYQPTALLQAKVN